MNTVYTLALKSCPLIGDATIKKLIFKFGNSKNVWKASAKDLLSIHRIGKEIIKYIGNETILEKSVKEIDYCNKNNIKVITFEDEEYPALLRECVDFPVLFYSKGNIDYRMKMLSIVGTRNMTSYGKKFTENLVESFLNKNIILVSGLALGIDGVVHKKSAELNIPSLGIIANGLANEIYPYQHRELADLMILNGGLLSEYSLFSKPERMNFIQRNRLIAGISFATIIIESAYGGGAISTVKFANSYNRDVFALPGRITDKYSQGCNNLIKNMEAQILTKPNDIIDLIGGGIEKEIQRSLFVELNDDESEIVELIKLKGKIHIDDLSVELNKVSFKLMPILLNLELKNIINSLPGKYFDLI